MYILGLSGGLGHDAAACLVRDGRIVAMSEEERFTRQKHALRAEPLYATASCLNQAGITLSDVDYVALGWKPIEGITRPIEETLFTHAYFAGQRRPPIEPINHHIAHAAVAYYCAGYDEAAILVMDGQSEEEIATTLAYAKGPQITPTRSYGLTQSLGYFYQALTEYLGFGYGEEGKVMGLAPYGTARDTFPILQLTEDGYAIDMPEPSMPPGYRHQGLRKQWRAWLEDRFGPKVKPDFRYDAPAGRPTVVSEPTQRSRDIAASGQAALEAVVLHLAALLVRETRCRNLVISGGVGLNCSANGALLRSGIIDDLYVFPASGDAGTSAGAALALYNQLHPSGSRERVDHAYFGPSYGTEAVEALLGRLQVRAKHIPGIERVAADLLGEGKIIGWFQGSMEIGPRALGNRSILASPTTADMNTKVNTIKGREQWRPLAPSLLEESAPEYLEDPRDAPFMLTAQSVSAEKRDVVPAVVHVDGSCRPQVVTRARNPRFWALLQQIGTGTGVPVVLNTSFNLRGEPLVCTPLDAIRTFYGSALDALVIEDFLITKS
ncbi:MAG TPA: carbamoyltransferase C-terminal domain-containing protein [Chloroflexia bacterium]|nr:carbamoyltransferase C-terminal domain-containing protein [Chloroflexia bacterium]